jgi:lipoprotein-anchoring transpeptidase ErfK/SrfK
MPMHRLLILLLAVGAWGAAHGQTASPPDASATFSEDGPTSSSVETTASEDALNPRRDRRLYYVVNEPASLFAQADSSARLTRLPVRAPIHQQRCTDAWCRVQTEGGHTGYVNRSAISNVWIRVSKEERRLYLYRGTTQHAVFNADFGYNAFSDKMQRGSSRDPDHWRTPEGLFYIVHRNPNSSFDKALVLNYPTAEDAKRGLSADLISQAEHDAIVRAQNDFRMPPMNTDLGGWLEIHGDGTGGSTNWTQGCVAVHNDDMQQLWWWAEVGTPVLIE